MKCDARCWNSTSKNCKCECEGANHGGKQGVQGFPEPLATGPVVKTYVAGDAIYRVQNRGGRLFLDVNSKETSASGGALNSPLKPNVSADSAIRHVKANRGQFLAEILDT